MSRKDKDFTTWTSRDRAKLNWRWKIAASTSAEKDRKRQNVFFYMIEKYFTSLALSLFKHKKKKTHQWDHFPCHTGSLSGSSVASQKINTMICFALPHGSVKNNMI